MMRLVPIAALAALIGLSTAAIAQSQDTPPHGAPPSVPEESGRYSFHRIEDHFIRLDSVTGQVAQCGWGATGWSCNVVPDERAALEAEIARIRKENATLKKSLLTHGLELPADVKPDVTARKDEPPSRQPEATPDAQPKLPSDAELDRAFAFMRKVWRRLVEMMVDIQRDMQRKS